MPLRILMAALFAVVTVPALAQDSDVSPERLAKLQALTRKVTPIVEQLRGRQFKREVPAGVQSRKALSAFLKQEFERELPKGEIAKMNAMLAKVGQAPAGTDLGKVFSEVLGENIAGFYNPRTLKLFLVADPVRQGQEAMMEMMMKQLGTSLDAYVMVHELTHALDDQHFDLLGLKWDDLNDDDRITAMKCLIEGVAVKIMNDWLMGKMPPAMKAMVARQMGGDQYKQSMAQTGSKPALAKAPRYVKAGLLAPYTCGAQFIDACFKHYGGWEGIDKMYADPPASMEQVLHPEKYFGERDKPTDVTLSGLEKAFASAGYEFLGTETLGEFYLRELFVDRLKDDAMATRASTGWDGDRYAVYRKKGGEQTALALATVFDTEDDAKEFAAAWVKLLEAKYGELERAADTGPTAAGVYLGNGRHHIAIDGKKVFVLESVPQEHEGALLAQLRKAKMKERAAGLPRLPVIERIADPTATEMTPAFELDAPEGWTAAWADDAARPVELRGPDGSEIRVAVLPGEYRPARVARASAMRLGVKLSEFTRAKLEIELRDDAIQLHYSGVRHAKKGRRAYSQAVFALGGQTYVVLLDCKPDHADAHRDAFAAVVNSFRKASAKK